MQSLSAIFKMEFYKNQKYWKLSKDGTERRKKKLASPKTTDKLDKIYGVEEEYRNPEFNGEQVSSDNKVSLHEEPDDIPETLGPEVPDLPGPEVPDFPGPEVSDLPGPEVSDLPGPEIPDLPGPEFPDLLGPEVLDLPWQEVPDLPAPEVLDLPWPEVSDLPVPEVLDFPGPETPDQNLYWLHSSSGQPNSGDGSEALGQYTHLPAPQPYWQNQCGMEIAGILEELACDQYDGPGQHYLEATDAAGHEWLQEGYSLYKEEFTSLYDEDQGLPKLEIQVFDAPDPPMTEAMSCSIEVPAQDRSELLDDTVDFMRGAHLGLHSSEIDLNTTQECQSIGQDNLWALSLKQLARAIQRHKLTLALLLKEGVRRDQLSAHPVPYPRVPFDDWLVICDTNRLRPPEGILPGGYCAPSGSDGTGRGRGRLQQARKQYDTTC